MVAVAHTRWRRAAQALLAEISQGFRTHGRHGPSGLINLAAPDSDTTGSVMASVLRVAFAPMDTPAGWNRSPDTPLAVLWLTRSPAASHQARSAVLDSHCGIDPHQLVVTSQPPTAQGPGLLAPWPAQRVYFSDVSTQQASGVLEGISAAPGTDLLVVVDNVTGPHSAHLLDAFSAHVAQRTSDGNHQMRGHSSTMFLSVTDQGLDRQHPFPHFEWTRLHEDVHAARPRAAGKGLSTRRDHLFDHLQFHAHRPHFSRLGSRASREAA